MKIPSVKKNHLIAVSAVLVIVTVTLAAYFTVLAPPANNFQININSIDPADMGVDEWLEDWQALYDFVEGNYPFLDVKNRTHGYNWLDLKDHYEDRITNAQNNQEFLEIIMASLNALQNRHTWVMNPSEVVSQAGIYSETYPLNRIFNQEVVDAAPYWQIPYSTAFNEARITEYNALIVYDQGEYVVRNYNTTWEDKYGDDTIVTHVDGVPVDDAIKTLYELSFIDYDFHRGKNYVWSITPHDFGNDAVFTIENSTGYVDDITFETETGWIDIPYEYPSTQLSTTKYANDSIGYMYIGSFGSGMDAYYQQVLNFYHEIEDYDHLIIDVRGNTGGFYSVWVEGIVRPLIQETILHTQHFAYRTSDYAQQSQAFLLTETVAKDEFSYLPPEVLSDDYQIHKNWMTINPLGELNFTGEIVVLMDNIVYSATEGFVNFCNEHSFATLYGTASGGDGIIVRPLNFVLPNSKLVINAASAIGLDATGHANEEVRTQPDIFFESSFGDWNALINFTISDLSGS